MLVVSVLLFLGGVAASRVAFAKDWAAYYDERVAAFTKENEGLDPKGKYVCLVGDSLTEGWSTARVKKYLPTLAPRVLNRGISSDGTGCHARGVIRRMDESIFKCHPELVVLLIGVNDIGKDGSGVEKAARTCAEIVKTIREKTPKVRLALVTLAPTTHAAAAMNPAIVKFNAHVKEIATANSATLIDLHAKIKDESGALPAACATKDGLHWTDGVYEVLGREIEKLAK